MSTAAAAGASAPPPPPPPGGGGDKRGPTGGPSGRQEPKKKKKKVPTAVRRGRPLQAMERMTIMNIWYQLSPSARNSLLINLGEMIGESHGAAAAERRAVVPPPPAPEVRDNVAEGVVRGRPTRVWDREILRDIPALQAYARMSRVERRNDTTQVIRRANISMGVVARGLEAGVPAADITASIIANWQDITALSQLYTPPAPANEESKSVGLEEDQDMAQS